MSGKEATVYVVEREGHIAAAKVRKARDVRTFKKTASYVGRFFSWNLSSSMPRGLYLLERGGASANHRSQAASGQFKGGAGTGSESKGSSRSESGCRRSRTS